MSSIFLNDDRNFSQSRAKYKIPNKPCHRKCIACLDLSLKLNPYVLFGSLCVPMHGASPHLSNNMFYDGITTSNSQRTANLISYFTSVNVSLISVSISFPYFYD